MVNSEPYASFKYPEFNRFLLVRFAIVFAWSMQFVVIEWEVYSITKSPLALGYIGLLEVIPAVLMALFAGHVADRKDNRTLLMNCITGFSAISLGLFLLTWPRVVAGMSSHTVLLGIYVLVFLGGFVRAFIGPTVFSLMAFILPRRLYPNGATWNSTVGQLARVLGPALGGFTIGMIGVHWSMCVIFGFSLLALITLTGISKKPIMNKETDQSVWNSLSEGLRFVFREKSVLGAITLDMVAVLFGGAVAILPVFAQDILKVGSEGFGILRAAPAVGTSLIMIVSAYFPLYKNAGMKLLSVVFGFGLSILVFGLSTSFWLSVIALFFSGVTDGVSMIIRDTILQLRTPDAMRGRVASVNAIFVGSSNELGAFESGLTARLMGTVTSVVFGGTMTLLTVVTTGLALPAFRKLDLEKDLKKHLSD
ncbi:MFS transporter [Olivibacter domesticus]|uniref:Predicted arabinose efflux permease, MFS family n=1 Tax=Olivibacter domesticus TaxID=407022 RepID=A0A1H7H2Q9_OLID1|nr:MFS transporter [Olivibacter domesticus]SEK43582.1 Predicted arabinose efflux permease, MFS family [Olivibacter domesticus]